MTGLFRKVLVTLVVILVSGSLLAQETPPATDTTAAPRRYTVEVIVFVYAQDVSVGTETFVPKRTAADGVESAAESVPSYGDDRARQSMSSVNYVRLRRDQLTMTDTAGMLNRLQAYKPVMHFGWTQTTMPDLQTPIISLDKLGTPPRGLGGSLNLYLSRYLHLVVDLALEAPASAQRSDIDRPGSPLQYLIKEDRIMKNEEIRYYDHPKFGVIAKVTRIKEAAESGEQSNALSTVSVDE